MKKYILLYGDKKPEDYICITNMFKESKLINLGWTEIDYNYNMKIIAEEINKGVEQIIFLGLEIGWKKLLINIKKQYPNIIIKVIVNTLDSLLYYDYERNNFFDMLELSKEKVIYDIAFLRKSQYETYKKIGYKCSYLRENYQLDITLESQNIEKKNEEINLGIYPLNYTWDKNIFNQLCIAKFIENCNLNYNNLDERMQDFLQTMEIKNTAQKIEKICDKSLIKELRKNDVIVATSFTEYLHPIFFLSMEMGIPCLIGNNSDFFEEDDKLKQYIVTTSEDNPILNAQMIKRILKEKEEINSLYKIWKEQYNKKAQEKINEFLEK